MKLETNHKLAGLVPMASNAEQAVLTSDIERKGQLEPIVLWQGKIIDGRSRNLSCITLGIEPIIRELPWNTTEEEARAIVKSLNTRRNLSPTQKIMSACRVSLDESLGMKIADIAKEWGISASTLKNARFIAKQRPEFAQTLFEGKVVTITGSNGKTTVSNKVSAIYSYLRREVEKAVEDTTYGWDENSYIRTQAGKEWYYEQIALVGIENNHLARAGFAELANYKFTTKLVELEELQE